MKIKLNSKKISKIKLYAFIIELPVLLIIGIYNLINDNGILIHSFVALIIGFSISMIKTIVSRTGFQKEEKIFTKRNIVIGIILYFFCILLSVLRKKIIVKYFIGQQIIILTIWFLVGVILENIIVSVIKEEIKIPLIKTVLK